MPLVCPAQADATAYLWDIDGDWTTTSTDELPADEVPANATISCAPIGSEGVLQGLTFLITGGVRLTAVAGTSTSSSNADVLPAPRARRRHEHVTVTIESGHRVRLQLLAYNTHPIVTATSHTGYRLADRKTITVRRGITKIALGRKVKLTGYAVFLRGVAHRHHKTVYGKLYKVS